MMVTMVKMMMSFDEYLLKWKYWSQVQWVGVPQGNSNDTHFIIELQVHTRYNLTAIAIAHINFLSLYCTDWFSAVKKTYLSHFTLQ